MDKIGKVEDKWIYFKVAFIGTAEELRRRTYGKGETAAMSKKDGANTLSERTPIMEGHINDQG